MEKNNHPNHKPAFIKSLVPIVIIIAVVFVLLKLMSGMKTEPTTTADKPAGFLVKTAQLKPSDLTVHIKSQGSLQAKRQINLVAEVSGKVQSINQAFTAGGSFEAGDVLVQLDPADYRVAVARAEANLAGAQASLDLEQARSDQAKKDWQSFGKKGQPSQLLLNIPQLDGAKANLKAAQADLMKAKHDLAKTAITAPFDGTVISKAVDLGQFVAMSGPLGVIAGTSVAEVRLPLSNSDLAKLALGNRKLAEQPLEVTFINEQNQTVATGLIRHFESSKDSKTLMNYAVAEINNPFAKGMLFNSFLQANITGTSYQQVYPVPSAWMMPEDQVAIYQADNTLDIRAVNVVHKTNDFFYVDQGLSEQDQVITTPIQAPEAGMLLRHDDSSSPTALTTEASKS
jgi:RND family efflux transporter MFP subunit